MSISHAVGCVSRRQVVVRAPTTGPGMDCSPHVPSCRDGDLQHSAYLAADAASFPSYVLREPRPMPPSASLELFPEPTFPIAAPAPRVSLTAHRSSCARHTLWAYGPPQLAQKLIEDYSAWVEDFKKSLLNALAKVNSKILVINPCEGCLELGLEEDRIRHLDYKIYEFKSRAVVFNNDFAKSNFRAFLRVFTEKDPHFPKDYKALRSDPYFLPIQQLRIELKKLKGEMNSLQKIFNMFFHAVHFRKHVDTKVDNLCNAVKNLCEIQIKKIDLALTYTEKGSFLTKIKRFMLRNAEVLRLEDAIVNFYLQPERQKTTS